MATGALTAYASRHTDAFRMLKSETFAHQLPEKSHYFYIGGGLLGLYSMYFWIKKDRLVLPQLTAAHIFENTAYFLSAVVFGIGLGISGMCDPSRVLNFLDFSGTAGWDPTLTGVMGGGVLINLVTNWILHRAELDVPLSSKSTKHSDVLKMSFHEANLKIDSKLIIGSALFGIGWGLGGICPGPALVSWAGNIHNALYFVPALMTGIAIEHQFLESHDAPCTKKKK